MEGSNPSATEAAIRHGCGDGSAVDAVDNCGVYGRLRITPSWPPNGILMAWLAYG